MPDVLGINEVVILFNELNPKLISKECFGCISAPIFAPISISYHEQDETKFSETPYFINKTEPDEA